MKQKYTQNQKNDIIRCYLGGEKVMSIHKLTRISRSTIYTWIKENYYNNNVKDHVLNLKDYNDLNRKYERSKIIIKILQTAPCLATGSIDDKFSAVENMLPEGYNVNVLCEI